MQDYIDAKVTIEPSINATLVAAPSITGRAALNTFKYIDPSIYITLDEGWLVTESGSFIIQEVA